MKNNKKTFLSVKINFKLLSFFIVLVFAFVSFSFLLGGAEENPEDYLIYAGSSPEDGWYCADEVFEAPTHTLTVTSDSGGRTSPSGTNTYEEGHRAYIYAYAEDGYAFDEWSEACSGTTSSCSVLMDSDKSVHANFEEEVETHYIRCLRSGLGSFGGDCGTHVEHGENATVEAIPDSGWEFDRWHEDSDASGTNPTYIINNVTENKTVFAYFEPEGYKITCSVGTGSGSLGGDCGETVEDGESAIVRAYSDPGFTFSVWHGDIHATSSSHTITNITDDIEAIANFELAYDENDNDDPPEEDEDDCYCDCICEDSGCSNNKNCYDCCMHEGYDSNTCVGLCY